MQMHMYVEARGHSQVLLLRQSTLLFQTGSLTSLELTKLDPLASEPRNPVVSAYPGLQLQVQPYPAIVSGDQTELFLLTRQAFYY